MSKFVSVYGDHKRVSIEFKPGYGATKQAHKDECDVNIILAKYRKTGRLPDLISRDPRFGDFTEVGSYLDSMNVVALANEQFAALPAEVRDRFANDPARFLAFAHDPKNSDDLIKMGLATKKSQPQPSKDELMLNELKELNAKTPKPRKPKVEED